MPRVEISLFGSFSLIHDGQPQHLAIAGATQSLLQFLICFAGRPARREHLVELFWPNVRLERRRAALNSAIWRIKKALAPFDGFSIDTHADAVTMCLDPEVRCDARALSDALQAATAAERPSTADLTRLADVLEVCEAPLLDGLGDDWAVIERERLSGVQLRGLTLMMHALAERKSYDEALDYSRRILAIDPFRESTIQEAMCLCVLSGQRVKALRLYNQFAKSLKAELAIAPMAETLTLYAHIANDRAFDGVTKPCAAPKTATDWGRRLDDQLSTIERSRLELYRTMRSVPA